MSNQLLGPIVPAPVPAPLPGDAIADLAARFKALGDPVRLKLLALIAGHEGGEACVCDISGHFDLAQPTISHHLRVLREAGILTNERRGTWVHYRIAPGFPGELSSGLSDVLSSGHGAIRGSACADDAVGAP